MTLIYQVREKRNSDLYSKVSHSILATIFYFIQCRSAKRASPTLFKLIDKPFWRLGVSSMNVVQKDAFFLHSLCPYLVHLILMMIIHRKNHSALSVKGTVSMSANNAFQSCCCLLKPTCLMYPWVFWDTILHIHTHGREIPFGGIQSWELCFSQNLPREWPSCQLSLPCWGPSRRPQLSLPPAGHAGPAYCSGGPAGRSPAEGKEAQRQLFETTRTQEHTKAQIWCHWWKYWRDLTTFFLRDMADVLLSLLQAFVNQ